MKFSKVCQKAITVSSETDLVRYSGKGFCFMGFFFPPPSTVCSNFDSQGHLSKSPKPFEKQPHVLLSSRNVLGKF